MSDGSDEETDEPLIADHRNFYKVEKWTKDGTKSTAWGELVSLIDSVVEQLSQVFMLRFFHVGTNC